VADDTPCFYPIPRRPTHPVVVGGVTIGGGAPVVVQSMTDTDTADPEATASQCLELSDAGAELVRIAVNTPEAAAAVPEIRRRLDDSGCCVPLIGDFHFNGHRLLTSHPECARNLSKLRVNPGNVGGGERRDANFATICKVARDHGLPIRIGVNGGSLDRDLVDRAMRENGRRENPLGSGEVLARCMVTSALESAALAATNGLTEQQIVLSCKVSQPAELIPIYRALAGSTSQPLHLGLTEAGMGTRGLVWSASALGVLLMEGIGDTIRVSLTPAPGGDRRQEVTAACEILQALGIRSFAPTVISCPGCGRTFGATYRQLALRVEEHLRRRAPVWKADHPGVERLRVAVMGCVVNGPGESKSANIGISLPGTGEDPRCPVYADGVRVATLRGTVPEIAAAFIEMIEEYVAGTPDIT